MSRSMTREQEPGLSEHTSQRKPDESEDKGVRVTLRFAKLNVEMHESRGETTQRRRTKCASCERRGLAA